MQFIVLLFGAFTVLSLHVTCGGANHVYIYACRSICYNNYYVAMCGYYN